MTGFFNYTHPNLKMQDPKDPSRQKSILELTPEEITGIANRSTKATKGCCECTYEKDGVHSPTGKIQQLAADNETPNGHNDIQ
ncbi:hypothetical protein [Martelella mangrovi]|uniref:Uncharacterized protein n=1 Tax=Martelella mangrovi TaxID=1397477 RepID=A0ABV2IG37_9HYPH